MSMLRSLWPRGKRKRSHLEDKMDFSECKSAEAVDMESLRSDFTAVFGESGDFLSWKYSPGLQKLLDQQKRMKCAALNSNDPSQTQMKYWSENNSATHSPSSIYDDIYEPGNRLTSIIRNKGHHLKVKQQSFMNEFYPALKTFYPMILLTNNSSTCTQTSFPCSFCKQAFFIINTMYMNRLILCVMRDSIQVYDWSSI